MSAGNWFLTRKKGFDERTTNLDTTTDGVTYTIRVGASTDDFICDRVLNWTIVDALGSVTITVPDGLYEGQRVLINYAAEDAVCADEVIVTPTTALVTATYTLGELGDYCSLEWVNATGGWVYLAYAAT